MHTGIGTHAFSEIESESGVVTKEVLVDVCGVTRVPAATVDVHEVLATFCITQSNGCSRDMDISVSLAPFGLNAETGIFRGFQGYIPVALNPEIKLIALTLDSNAWVKRAGQVILFMLFSGFSLRY